MLAGAFLLIAATGCASRAAPFDQLDKSSVTVLRLQQYQAPPPPPPVVPGIPGLPAIPGLDPNVLNPAIQQLCPLIPPGTPPQFIPPQCQPGGVGPIGPGPAQPRLYGPAQPQYQWMIAQELPLLDEKLKEDLLDLFGDDASFNENRPPCFSPGIGFSFADPAFPQPVDVVVSFSCNQAVGYGFQWPHKVSGLTQESYTTLSTIYQQLFGQPVPPGS